MSASRNGAKGTAALVCTTRMSGATTGDPTSRAIAAARVSRPFSSAFAAVIARRAPPPPAAFASPVATVSLQECCPRERLHPGQCHHPKRRQHDEHHRHDEVQQHVAEGVVQADQRIEVAACGLSAPNPSRRARPGSCCRSSARAGTRSPRRTARTGRSSPSTTVFRS